MCGMMRWDGQPGNHTLRLLSKHGVSPWWPQCTNARWNRCQEDLNSFTLENWRPPGRPRTTWMKTIQQDLKSNNLSLNEAIDVAQNHPLWRLMSTFGATHACQLIQYDHSSTSVVTSSVDSAQLDDDRSQTARFSFSRWRRTRHTAFCVRRSAASDNCL